MNPRDVIAKAWAITKKERQLRRWGYASALLETLLNLKLLIYQVWFFISYWQGNPIEFFTVEATLMKHVPLWVFILIIVTLLLLIFIEWLFPHLAKGAIIGLGAKIYKKEEVKGGLVLAVYNFFPLFAIHEIFFLGSVATVITLISFILRYGEGIAPFGITLVLLLFVFSLLMHFFFIFSEEAVVIRKLSIGSAMRNSFKLVISYLGQVVFLLILAFVITLRIFLNAIMLFLVPGIVIGIGILAAMFLPSAIAWSIAILIGIIIVGLASYLFAYLEVFRQNIWTLTYLELSKFKELDVIGVE